MKRPAIISSRQPPLAGREVRARGLPLGSERRAAGEAGQTIIIFALALAGLLAMFFFVVDVGRLFMAKQTLESIAALAADAGASYANDWAVARFEWQRNYADPPLDASASFTAADFAALAADGPAGVADDVRHAASQIIFTNLAAYPSLFAPGSISASIDVPYAGATSGANDFGVRVSITARMPLAFGNSMFGVSIPLTAVGVSRVTIAPCPNPCQNQSAEGGAEILLPLQNADFEDGFQRVQAQELNVAIGWRAWFIDDGVNLRPEYKDATAPYMNRVYSGNHAQQFFRTFSPLDAGIQQTVTVPFKGRVRFSIQAQAWSTSTGNPDFSEGDGQLTMQIGIDPTGGSNPFSPSVVWSKAMFSYDAYSPFRVEAFASGNAITVYTRGKAVWGVQNNDVYFDHARLAITVPQYGQPHVSAEQASFRYPASSLHPVEAPTGESAATAAPLEPTAAPLVEPTSPAQPAAEATATTSAASATAAPVVATPAPPPVAAAFPKWALYVIVIVLVLGYISLIVSVATRSKEREE